MRDRYGTARAFQIQIAETHQRQYILFEPDTGSHDGSSSTSFMHQFKLGVGDAVGIYKNNAGLLVLDCHTARFPCPQILAAAVESDKRNRRWSGLCQAGPKLPSQHATAQKQLGSNRLSFYGYIFLVAYYNAL